MTREQYELERAARNGPDEITRDTQDYLSLREPKSERLAVLEAWRDFELFKNIPHVPDSNDPLEALLYRTVEAIDKAES